MRQVDKFAEATRLAIRSRQPKEPFFQDFCIRVVGESEAMVFELWTRIGSETTRLGVHPTFAEAQNAADRENGQPVPESSWRECEPVGWSFPTP